MWNRFFKNMKAIRDIKLILVIIAALLVLIGVSYSFSLYLKKRTQPNIVLITIDALRPDHLGCYGYERNTSPNIDKLAAEGTLFLNTVSAGPGSLPAIISLITSKYGPEHKVESWGDILNKDIVTLPQLLKSQSFTTAFVSAHYSIPETIENRKDKDWDFFINYSSEVNKNNFYIINNANRVTKNVISQLKKNRFRQFFLWMHFMDVHAPYRPPEPYNKIYVDDVYYKGATKVKLLSDENWNSFGGIPKYMQLGKNNILDYYISQYDGEIKFVDENIGKIVTYLEELDLCDNTIIIITADHGEVFGEHNYFGHDRILCNTTLKVPLIIIIPWIQNQREKVAGLVETIDIAPTILDLLNLKIPKDFQGESLSSLILNKRKNRKKDYAFSSTAHADKKFSIITDEWKLIFDKEKNKYEFYNLKDASVELSDMIRKEKNKFIFLKSKLEWHIGENIKSAHEEGIDRKNKKILKSLGYVE